PGLDLDLAQQGRVLWIGIELERDDAIEPFVAGFDHQSARTVSPNTQQLITSGEHDRGSSAVLRREQPGAKLDLKLDDREVRHESEDTRAVATRTAPPDGPPLAERVYRCEPEISVRRP